MAIRTIGAPSKQDPYLNFMAQFKEEDYILIADEIEKIFKIENRQLYEISKNSSFRQLKQIILDKIISINDLSMLNENIARRQISSLDAKKIRDFTDNSRLMFFAINYLSNKLELPCGFLVTSPETFLTHLININMYYFYKKNSDFLNEVENIKKNFLRSIDSKKNITKYKNNNEFIEWCNTYLERKQRYGSLSYLNTHPYPRGLKNEEIKLKIISFLDILFYSNSEKHEILINSIKKSWQQKCFRDKGGIKKLYHLPLTKQAKSELEKLSAFNNKSENQILEDLIHQMYLREMCDKNGKPLY